MRVAVHGLALDFDGIIDIDWTWTQRRLAVLCVSLLVGLVMMWLAVDLFLYHTVNDDEGVYLTQAAILLEGKLSLYPGRLTETARPWFFMVQETPSASGDIQLYSKCSPAVPALFAVGLAVGLPSLMLGAIAAMSAALVYALTAGAFDRTTGVVTAGLLSLSPLFLLTSSTLLVYVPTMILNLGLAVYYVRAVRRDSSDYAVVVGALVGAAFFARPYTAVLFALPFIAHSLWALATTRRAGTGRVVFRRYAAIALPDLAFVGLMLVHNTIVTDDPLTFPCIAFASWDGVGFGERAVLGYEVVYTPAMGVETAAEAFDLFVAQWGPMGWLETVAAVVGPGITARCWWGHGTGRNLRGSARRRHHSLGGRDRTFIELSGSALACVIAGVSTSVFIGNAAFWGIHNGLRNGLIDPLSPFYHFDTLVPLAVFGAADVAAGARLLRRLTHRRFSASEAHGAVLSVFLMSALFADGVTVGTAEDPYDENRLQTENLTTTYKPLLDAGFEQPPLTPPVPDVDTSGLEGGNDDLGIGGDSATPGNETKALVSHPDPYNDWSAHPFQVLRNNPGFDGPVMYIIDGGVERDFAVLDAANQTPYRFTYRGMWAGAVDPVEPELTRLDVLAGKRIGTTATLGMPEGTNTASVRVETDEGYTRCDMMTAENLAVEWSVSSAGMVVTNRPLVADPERLSISADTSEIDLVVAYISDFGEMVTYRRTATVERSSDEVRVVWSLETRVCRLTTDCGNEREWVGPDGDYLDGVSVETDARVAWSGHRKPAAHG